MTSTIEWFSLKSFAQLLHLFARHAPHTSAIVRHSRYRMESGDRTLCSRQLESPISTTELPGVVLQAQQCRPALRCAAAAALRNSELRPRHPDSALGSAELRPRRPDSRECKCRRRPWAPLGISGHLCASSSSSSSSSCGSDSTPPLRWQRRQRRASTFVATLPRTTAER